jgi:hypothetical protein
LQIARQDVDGIAVDASVRSRFDRARGFVQVACHESRACDGDQFLLARELVCLLLLLLQPGLRTCRTLAFARNLGCEE